MCVSSRATLNFAANKTDNSDQIYVFFADEPSVGIKTMRKSVSPSLSSWLG